MLPKSRKEAKSKGEKHYLNGVPCPSGHISTRHTDSGGCSECSRIRSRGYAAKKRKEKCPLLAARKKRDKEKNREKYDAYMSAYMEENKNKKREYDALRYLEKRSEMIEKSRKWAIDNPEERRAQHRNRKHRIRNAGTHTAEEVREMLKKQKNKCIYCKTCIKRDRHIDHIIPISEGGSNEIHNLQGLCPDCNMRKSNKMPEVWANEIGILI